MVTLRQSNLLTLPDGIYPDGNNLYFRVRNQGRSRDFLYRCTIRGKATYKSLGTLKKVQTLKEARQKAKEFDPEAIATRIKFSSATVKAIPFVVLQRHWKHEKESEQRFIGYINKYWMPKLGPMLVYNITSEHIAEIIKEAWIAKPPSAKKAVTALKLLFNVFVSLNYCKENPVIWNSKLEYFLPEQSRIHSPQHMKFISAEETRKLLSSLLTPRNSRIGSRIYLLIFVILSVLRVGEALSLKWEYLKESPSLGKYFDIPKEFRKGYKDSNHILPITKEMEDLLNKIPRKSPYLFYSYRTNEPIVRTSASKLFKDLNIPCSFHGFRSTFRSWAAENSLDHNACELILSHEIGTKVTRSYYRTDLYHKRKEILTLWNKYLFSNIDI